MIGFHSTSEICIVVNNFSVGYTLSVAWRHLLPPTKSVKLFCTRRQRISSKLANRLVIFYSNICPTRCNVVQLCFIFKLLYMFRVVPSPIIRSANNCIYSIWYVSHRYCYLECAVPQTAPLLRSWVRIPPGAWIFVCCECRVLSGRGLCDELITRPEDSYRLWCVVACYIETSRIGAPYIYMTLVA